MLRFMPDELGLAVGVLDQPEARARRPFSRSRCDEAASGRWGALSASDGRQGAARAGATDDPFGVIILSFHFNSGGDDAVRWQKRRAQMAFVRQNPT